MSTTPDTTRGTTRPIDGRTAPVRRFIITAEEGGPVIRSIPAARPVVTQPAPQVPETVAEDRRHLIHMRRFLRTALDRNHR
jgi:hypothetical protein